MCAIMSDEREGIRQALTEKLINQYWVMRKQLEGGADIQVTSVVGLPVNQVAEGMISSSKQYQLGTRARPVYVADEMVSPSLGSVGHSAEPTAAGSSGGHPVARCKTWHIIVIGDSTLCWRTGGKGVRAYVDDKVADRTPPREGELPRRV